MNSLVSICIPTYRRPAMLRETIESCLAQTYTDYEIVVSDDSPDDETEAMLTAWNLPRLRYFHNRPGLRQAGNVNNLLQQARGDRLVLLHDDDLLFPDALQTLAACWEADADTLAAFGKQMLITMQGAELPDESAQLNADYQRTPERAGRQPSTLASAIMAQFPNNGYMVRTEAARQTGYRATPEIGEACDLDFGLRLAAQPGAFHFVDRFTAKYRLTDVSVSRGDSSLAACAYHLLSTLDVPPALEPMRRTVLRRRAAAVVNYYLKAGNRRDALAVYTSPNYPLARRLSPRGLQQGLLLLCPTGLVRFAHRARRANRAV